MVMLADTYVLDRDIGVFSWVEGALNPVHGPILSTALVLDD